MSYTPLKPTRYSELKDVSDMSEFWDEASETGFSLRIQAKVDTKQPGSGRRTL